jgi:anti-sigma factor RsiW
MPAHEEFRELLVLVAAGAASAEEQTRLERHVQSCGECAADYAAWLDLAGALRELPTPLAPAGLAGRTVARVSEELAIADERRFQVLATAIAVAISWLSIAAVWGLFSLWGVKPVWLAVWVGTSWLTAGASAVLLGWGCRNWRTI